jgi:Tol biopolymer transport system component
VVENVTRGAISPDGTTLAFLRDEARVDIVGTAALWLSKPGPAPWDNKAVGAAAGRYGTFGGQRFIEGALAFSPDGTKLALSVVSNPHEESAWEFWIVPLTGGTEYRRFTAWADAAPRISNFTWLPDSRHVVLGMASLSTPGSRLWIADTERDHAWSLTEGPGSQSYPSASPDGRRIVFANDDVDYDLVEIPLDGSAVRPFVGTTRNESDPDIYKQLLAYVTDRRGQDEIWLSTRDGHLQDRPVVQQSDFGDDRTLMLSSPAISPDGLRIAYLRNGLKPRHPLRIWISNTAGGGVTPLLSSPDAFQGAPTWSPTGEWIAYSEWINSRWTLFKVRVGSGEAPVELRTDGVANAIPRWSPKGNWITWETEQGFVLVSPDGKGHATLAPERLQDEALFRGSWLDDPWLVHTWSLDGSAVIGIKEASDRTLSLVIHPVGGKPRVVRDLGLAAPLNHPVRGLSISPDGRRVTTSVARLRGDLWVLDGLKTIAFPHRSN